MSWQAYIDNLLASGSVTAAGIYDLQGNPWAYSAGFAAQVAEVAHVSAHMHADRASDLTTSGVKVAGQSYMFISGDSSEVYAKTMRPGSKEGVVFCKCNTCIILAHHNDQVQPGACRTAIGKLADYLKEQNI